LPSAVGAVFERAELPGGGADDAAGLRAANARLRELTSSANPSFSCGIIKVPHTTTRMSMQ
jgi:hypothetical protein